MADELDDSIETAVDEATLAELKAKHGELFQLRAALTGDVVVVRRPPEPLWRRFRTQMMDPGKKAYAPEQMLLDCIVHPERKTVQAMFTALPGLVETFAGELATLGGAGQDVQKKAL